MREFLAVDAGGTSTRAVLIDETGSCRGAGRAAGGNPTSSGPARAADSVAAAIALALDSAAADPGRVAGVLIAHAGGHDDYEAGVRERLDRLGVGAPVTRAGDLLALFASGTAALEGAALISGTGAIGGAIRGGALERTVDGTGWLLGDSGSGFWIGHRVARAVVDDLDGGPRTALTAALLPLLDLDAEPDRAATEGRPAVLGALVRALYALRPVELSRFAPLAFAHPDDAVAAGIVREAVGALVALLDRVRAVQPDGPLVFGGSVLMEGVLRLPREQMAPLLAAAGDREPIPVADGLVGAAVLALRAAGVTVDDAVHARLSASVRAALVRAASVRAATAR
ncbi:BadF/BadG/BcrA/BcrD ATPase family protein [Amnibacterium setariae]|nr:BadF/BadG/BcrA/BcrD ATPase family protein [Amnibacterium setariae]